MTNISTLAATPVAPSIAPASAAIAQAALLLLPGLERGRRIDAAILRAAMGTGFGASDAAGAWDWKCAYDACEAATVLFLRKFGHALRAKAASPVTMLPIFTKTRPVRLFGGGTRDKSCIYFSGFSSQGDGACFKGHYAYEKGVSRKIKAYAPQDTELRAIADPLQGAQPIHKQVDSFAAAPAQESA